MLDRIVTKKEKMLGFGGGGAEVFITMTILPLILGVVTHIGKAGVETLKDEGSKALSRLIKDKIERKVSQPSKDNLKLMRECVYNNALTMGVEKEKAGVIADSFIGNLALM